MLSVNIFNKTGERFHNEGEYAGPGFPAYSGSVYASEEDRNKIYKFPADAIQQHFFQRKPMDCGTVKILANNIGHLCYQKCRTLAVIQGPGSFGYTESDLDITYVATYGAIYAVETGYPRWTSGMSRDQYVEIGWSQYSSRRLGPFFAVSDRKLQYSEAVNDDATIANNTVCIRKMILVIKGYKGKIPTVGGVLADGVFRIHVVVTNDGSNPANPNAGIIPLCAEQRAWVEGFGGVAQQLPITVNTPSRVTERQGWPAYTIDLAGATIGTDPDGIFKLFIPVDCIGDTTITNASPNGINLFQYYVHVGWYAGMDTSGISSISLLEARDPGSAICD